MKFKGICVCAFNCTLLFLYSTCSFAMIVCCNFRFSSMSHHGSIRGSLMIPICILFLFLSQFYWQKKEQMNVDLNTPFVSWQWHDLKCVPGKCAKVKGTSQLNGFVLYQRSGANFVCVCRSWLIIWLCDSSNDKCYQQQILFAIRSVLVKCFNFLAFCHPIVRSSNSLCVCLCEYRGTRKIAH